MFDDATVDLGSVARLPKTIGIHAARDRSTLVAPSPSGIPQRIAGRYEIKELIGSGGMGEVYEAWQDQPRRLVAIKIMRVAVPTPEALHRFEYESQLLARLRHPCIAQVYDAGAYFDNASGASLPYFVMEFVPGAMPLTAYCDEKKLALRERLELFIRVCDAVSHAHQHGVIHRDLKPANILIDNTVTPKVIDFGIASASDRQTSTPDEDPNAPVRIIGTLEYMPPEQCSRGIKAADAGSGTSGTSRTSGTSGTAGGGRSGDVDTRADVYSLGVTLYELLTGRMPYDLAGRGVYDAVRVICEIDPSAPSNHNRQLGIDLDAVILKALRKSPADRYDSVSAFAADIKRFLANDPILARHVSVPGRIVRWGRRNRAVATAIAVSGVVLAVTSVVLIGQILRESDRANTNLAEAQRNLVAASENLSLITALFSSIGPNQLDHGRVDVERMLDSAVQKFGTSAPTLPETEASFRQFLAEAYRGINVYAKAIAQQRRVVELREAKSTAPSKELADSLHLFGAVLWWNGDNDEARNVYSRSLAMRKSLYPGDHPDIATSLTHLAACDLRVGRLAQAQDLYTQALEMRQRIFSPGSAEVAASFNNLAKCVQLRGDSVRAESLFRKALDLITQAKGDADIDTASAAHNLASFLLERGPVDEAATRFRQALTIRSARLAKDNHLVASSRLGLARAQFEQKPDAATLEEATKALEILEQKLPAGHPEIADASTAVANMLVKLGDFEKAARLYRTALSIRKDIRHTAPWELVKAQLFLGQCLAALDKNEEAESLLRQSLDGAASNDALSVWYAKAQTSLAELYDKLNRPDEAKRVREAAPKVPRP